MESQSKGRHWNRIRLKYMTKEIEDVEQKSNLGRSIAELFLDWGEEGGWGFHLVL